MFGVPAGPSQSSSQDYLQGLRGVLAIQSFLFVFFQLFLPAAVADSANTTGPLYQIVLRKTLSVLFWNESLIYSFVILLSARTICLPFLTARSRAVAASAIFRRGIRLFLPTFVAYSLCAVAFSTTSTQYITDFLVMTGNMSTTPPMRLRNFLVYFNSLYEAFWLNKLYSSQAANRVFPSGTLWILSVLFQQSYTVYMTMVIIPYTRKSWRVKALLVFIATAWWVQSWAWYSITGLLLADAVVNMNFQYKCQSGVRVGRLRVPMWFVYGLTILVGTLLQYLFIAWRPEMRSQELKGHTGLYTVGTLNEKIDLEQPQARDDNFLVVLGIMLMVESYEGLKRALRWRPLVSLGRRSLSIFLVQPLLLYVVGIRLYMRVHTSGGSHELTTLVCFIVCVPVVGIASEIFHRMIDLPSVMVAREAWVWCST
ncbi:hypothetical protein P280DRAFT_496572 [Massarina eburnea CBS 473.64]|uniref:Acyltransferase 3 domain-containing protein n=1 Tax=Massarina eburnea CBS 473.64 TaxID=1395130 RepID=A0A6A6SBE6_9PLEO|nr:hypothetical protein P280DRAFT_496572 [Massarina eburnea CBS 473.64]